jgi:hypothetical protein
VSSLGSPGQIARETSTQWPPGPATSSDGSTQSVFPKRREPAILNSGRAAPAGPSRTMSIVQRPHPSETKYSSQGASTSRCVFPGAKCSRKIQKPSVLIRTDSRTEASSSSDFTIRAWSNGTSHATSSAAPSTAA